MRRKLWLVFAVLVLSSQPSIERRAPAQSPAKCDDCGVIEEALKAVSDLVPGRSRERVEQEFRLDGGLHFFHGPRRYTFRKCPLIKVDIEFKQFDGQQDELPTDPVVKVSRPYLEYPFSD